MQVREAKDFLVRETAKQAQLEGVALSELENRMMYFTESGYCPEDFIALNDQFEAEYDTEEYEAKIHGLLHRAFGRFRKEDPENGKFWKEALKELSRGDHYLTVLWGSRIPGYQGPAEARPPGDFLKLLGTGLLVVALLISAFIVLDHYGIHWDRGYGREIPRTQTRMPVWLQRALIISLVGGYIYFALLPLILKKAPPGLGTLWSKLFRGGTRRIQSDR